jgi:hydroxyacylglutathione hydrolase
VAVNDAFRSARVPGDLPVVAVTDEGLGNTSWVLALDGDAVVVDPERDPAPYEAAVEQLGARIVATAETHLHADFVTGSRELAANGGSVLAAAEGDLAWPHRAIRDGDEVDLGRWRLRTLATPGHTPEHVAYLLLDDGRPRAVFSGGSLLVGAVARTDLIDPGDTEALTRALWRSINHRLLSLPDDVAVFPTHGAGSFCTAAGGGQRWTTIGAERRDNPLLQADDEGDFVRLVLAQFGSYPHTSPTCGR